MPMKTIKISFFIVLTLLLSGFFADVTSAGVARPFMNPTAQAVVTNTGSSNDSSNWAGYAAQGGTFTGVTGTWTVPAPTADATTTYATRIAADATWVGIGGVSTRNLIQA